MLRAIAKTQEAKYGRLWVQFSECKHSVLYDTENLIFLPSVGWSLDCPVCSRVGWGAMRENKLYRVYFHDGRCNATICQFMRYYPLEPQRAIFKRVRGSRAGTIFNVSQTDVSEIRSL